MFLYSNIIRLHVPMDLRLNEVVYGCNIANEIEIGDKQIAAISISIVRHAHPQPYSIQLM